MKNFGFRVCSIGVVFAMAQLFATQPAAANALTFNGLFYSSPDTVHISYSGLPSAVNRYVYSGGLSMTDTTPTTPVTFMAWCLDIFDNIASQTYTLVSASSYIPGWNHVPLDATKVLALERLASNNPVTNAAQSSAFQLAAWEIVDEHTALYSLSTGNFQAFGNSIHSPDTITMANLWLSNLGTASPTVALSIWRANIPGSTQDLAVFSRVPEPETYAMMLSGLGLMGFIIRRRNKNAV